MLKNKVHQDFYNRVEEMINEGAEYYGYRVDWIAGKVARRYYEDPEDGNVKFPEGLDWDKIEHIVIIYLADQVRFKYE